MSFVDAVRGPEKATKVLSKKKKIAIDLHFIGDKGQWRILLESLEAVHSSVQSYELMDVKSVMRREIEDFKIEI